jgi:hypothetical protein
MAMLRIGPSSGSLVDMPSPSSMEPGIQDISKAFRNTNGRMIKETITTKDKFELHWAFLSAEDTKKILQAVKAESFWVGYVSPVTNDYTVKEFYAGDRKAPILDCVNGVYRYKDVAFNIIEM